MTDVVQQGPWPDSTPAPTDVGSPGQPQDNPPPAVPEIEQALLASMLRRNAVYDQCGELKPEHFADELHARIYEAAAQAILEGKSVSASTLAPRFGDEEERDGYTVARYLHDLENTVVSLVNGREYAELIVDRAHRRRLRNVAANLWDYVHAEDKLDISAGRIAAELSNVLGDVQAGETGARPVDLPAVGEQALAEIEAAMRADGSVTGVPTGLADVDNRLSGIHPSDMLVLAGRPGMGKTAAGLTIARNAAMRGYRVGFFSLEQSASQVDKRLLAMETGIGMERLRSGDLDDSEYQLVADAQHRLNGLSLYIDDKPAGIERIQSIARWWQRRKGLDIVIIDYLGMIQGRPKESLYERASRLSYEVKQNVAKRLDVATVLLSQLSRAVEARDDKRPNLSDLRDSGTIEQDADQVAFVYREHEYVQRSEPQRKDNEDDEAFSKRHSKWLDRLHRTQGRGEILLRKNRHGRTSDIPVAWDAERGRFYDLAKQDGEGAADE
jgi:replicative DNA helicase